VRSRSRAPGPGTSPGLSAGRAGSSDLP